MGRHVNFDSAGYINALSKSLDTAMTKIDSEVYAALFSNLSGVNFRELDREHRTAMLSSIRKASTKTQTSIIRTYMAGGESQPNQSFRVVYYEYGTGEEMNPPKGYSPISDPYWNPARPKGVGIPHYQRPYSSWSDLGGNTHLSRTRGKPRPLSRQSRRGKPVEASGWFSNAIKQVTQDRIILNAVKSVPIVPYIRLRDIVKRM